MDSDDLVGTCQDLEKRYYRLTSVRFPPADVLVLFIVHLERVFCHRPSVNAAPHLNIVFMILHLSRHQTPPLFARCQF